jgi:nitrogen fixation-related uncharacterized protein
MAGIGALAGAVAAAIGKKTGLWGVALCVILTGCGTPESVRQSNAFNIEAGSDIVQVASELNALAETLTISSPPVAASLKAIAAHLKAVGENIREGSKQIERKLGAPENPQVYSVEKHAQTNAEAKKDIDDQEAVKKGITGWIEGAVKKVGDTLWPGLGGMAIGAFFWLRKNLQFNELKRGASVVIDTVNKLPPDMAKTVKGAVETAASKVGAGELVKGMVKKLES